MGEDHLINHLARLFAGALQDGIHPLGLSTGVFPIMVHLWDQDGLTQKELVGRVEIEQATMQTRWPGWTVMAS